MCSKILHIPTDKKVFKRRLLTFVTLHNYHMTVSHFRRKKEVTMVKTNKYLFVKERNSNGFIDKLTCYYIMYY